MYTDTPTQDICNANNARSISITTLYDGYVIALDVDAVNHEATEVNEKDPKGTVLCPQLSTMVRFLISLLVLDIKAKFALFTRGVHVKTSKPRNYGSL